MGTGQKTKSPFDRSLIQDSSVLAHAFKWRESVIMPVSRIEQAEGTQIVEEMLTKIAKKVHITNYNTFVSVLGKDVMSDLQTPNGRYV